MKTANIDGVKVGDIVHTHTGHLVLVTRLNVPARRVFAEGLCFRQFEEINIHVAGIASKAVEANETTISWVENPDQRPVRPLWREIFDLAATHTLHGMAD